MRFLFLLSLSIIFLSSVLIPLPAVACTCYADDGIGESITDYCVEACGEATATEYADGICRCSTTTVTVSCTDVCIAAGMDIDPPTSSTTEEVEDAIIPKLSIDIPTVSFSKVLNKDGILEINFLGDYINGIYKYLLGIGTTIAIVMIMIGGLQYAFGGVEQSQIKKSKDRISNAILGLVLLLSTYAILSITNPELSLLRSIKIKNIDLIALDRATTGNEGVPSNVSSSACDTIVAKAKSEGSCNIAQSVASPTGNKPNCGKHHWYDGGANGDFRKIDNLDYAAGWGTSILAPFDGTVTYQKSTTTSNRCGNIIRLTGTGDAAGASITICHAKDFVPEGKSYAQTRTVLQGESMGHLGGNCCAGESPPADWSSAENGWCKVAGTACSDPTKVESCGCQPVEQAGNTSGPHVHITWNQAGGDLLACIEY
ncbi:TrbC/VirB2 family protein [Candidatus Uhrbacteria bacterium]|nr:TrbC/VirB2 family protein [Candidatus Uhrbacteria bacterium]